MTQFLRLEMGPENLIWAPGKLAEKTGALYLGNIPNAMQWGQQGAEKRFKAILNCTDDPELDWMRTESWVELLRLDQWDGEEYPLEKIHDGIKFIDDNLSRGSAVLVCCHAGISRSSGMTLAYLMSLGYEYREGLRIIRKSRPVIQIHPKIDLSIRKYFRLAPRSAADLISGGY